MVSVVACRAASAKVVCGMVTQPSGGAYCKPKASSRSSAGRLVAKPRPKRPAKRPAKNEHFKRLRRLRFVTRNLGNFSNGLGKVLKTRTRHNHVIASSMRLFCDAQKVTSFVTAILHKKILSLHLELLRGNYIIHLMIIKLKHGSAGSMGGCPFAKRKRKKNHGPIDMNVKFSLLKFACRASARW